MTLSPRTDQSDTAALEVRLQGAFAVAVNGATIDAARWPSLRAAHLVQLLSLAPRRRLTRDHVVETLWPQLDAEAGAANLRKAVHHARQALGRHDACGCRAARCCCGRTASSTVDAEFFEQRAQAALAADDRSACAELAAGYAGDLLPAASFEAWARADARAAACALVELLRAGQQWETLARVEPSDEPAHRALMAAALDAGNRAAALRWYARLREALQQELGVEPDNATEALYDAASPGRSRRGRPSSGAPVADRPGR